MTPTQRLLLGALKRGGLLFAVSTSESILDEDEQNREWWTWCPGACPPWSSLWLRQDAEDVDLCHAAGWITSGRPPHRITPAGRAALERYGRG